MWSPRKGRVEYSVAMVKKPFSANIFAVSPPPQLRSRSLFLVPASLDQAAATASAIGELGIASTISKGRCRGYAYDKLVSQESFPQPNQKIVQLVHRRKEPVLRCRKDQLNRQRSRN